MGSKKRRHTELTRKTMLAWAVGGPAGGGNHVCKSDGSSDDELVLVGHRTPSMSAAHADPAASRMRV